MHGIMRWQAIHCCNMGTMAKSATTGRPSMTDLNELQFFVQVSKAQSFTWAARRMRVPKSSVSRAIARLEARLGVRLLERTTRSVTLTEAGALYLDHCQRVMEEAEQADLAMGALLAKPRGRLWVAAPLLGEFLA